MCPILTAAEGYILGLGAKMFVICGAGDCVRHRGECDLRRRVLGDANAMKKGLTKSGQAFLRFTNQATP